MPARLLAEYRQSRDSSELGQILSTAARIRENCDRVVVLGIGGSYMGARALMDTCCHPYHNELSRAQRGGRPRIYFEGNNVDNDASSGLLELLKEYLINLEEDTVRDNIIIIYELLDEIIDNGYPQTTDFKLMKKYITSTAKLSSSKKKRQKKQ